MPGIPRQLRGPLTTTLVIGVSVLLAWVAATVALSRPASAQLPTDLASFLEADYSADDQPHILPPLDSSIMEVIEQDERPSPQVVAPGPLKTGLR